MAIYGPKEWNTPFTKIIRFDLDNIQQMSPELNDNMIEANGVECELWPSVRCGCMPQDRQIPVPDCVACNGTGRFYPENGRITTHALMTSQTADRKSKSFGEEDDGTVTVTLKTGIQWYHNYQLLPKGKTHLVTERMYRGGRSIVAADIFSQVDNDIALPLATQSQSERLAYPKITELVAVYQGGGTEDMLEMVDGMDFDFVERVVVWKTGRGPEPGGPYSVVYKAPAIYLLENPRPRYSGNIELPSWCKASRLDTVTQARLGGGT